MPKRAVVHNVVLRLATGRLPCRLPARLRLRPATSVRRVLPGHEERQRDDPALRQFSFHLRREDDEDDTVSML